LIQAGFNSSELIYRLPKAQADGSSQLYLTALELIDRLAALIPRPRIHRYRSRRAGPSTPVQRRLSGNVATLVNDRKWPTDVVRDGLRSTQRRS
jgi:hypothetical protein